MRISAGDSASASFEIEFPSEELDKVMRDVQALGEDVSGGPRLIGASASYAIAVHETHPTNGKWFMRAIADNAQRILQGLVERAMSGGPGAERTRGRVLKQAAELLIGEAKRLAPKRTGFLARSHFNVEADQEPPVVQERKSDAKNTALRTRIAAEARLRS